MSGKCGTTLVAVADAAHGKAVQRIQDALPVFPRQVFQVSGSLVGVADSHDPRRARTCSPVTVRPSRRSRSPSSIRSASRSVTGSSSLGALANAAMTGLESDSTDNPVNTRSAVTNSFSGSPSTNR